MESVFANYLSITFSQTNLICYRSALVTTSWLAAMHRNV